MTAFQDVLNAEKEAEQSIGTAKREVSESVAQAEAESKSRIENEERVVREMFESDKISHLKQVDLMVSKIQAEIAIKVSKVENSFSANKANLKKKLVKHFQ